MWDRCQWDCADTGGVWGSTSHREAKSLASRVRRRCDPGRSWNASGLGDRRRPRIRSARGARELPALPDSAMIRAHDLLGVARKKWVADEDQQVASRQRWGRAVLDGKRGNAPSRGCGHHVKGGARTRFPWTVESLLLASKSLTRAPNPPYPPASTHDEADVEAARETWIDRGIDVIAADDERPRRAPDLRFVTNIAAAVARIASANATYLQQIKTARRPWSVTITYTSADTSRSSPERSAMKRSDSERFICGTGYRRERPFARSGATTEKDPRATRATPPVTAVTAAPSYPPTRTARHSASRCRRPSGDPVASA
jgi:hypothetical protein